MQSRQTVVADKSARKFYKGHQCYPWTFRCSLQGIVQTATAANIACSFEVDEVTLKNFRLDMRWHLTSSLPWFFRKSSQSKISACQGSRYIAKAPFLFPPPWSTYLQIKVYEPLQVVFFCHSMFGIIGSLSLHLKSAFVQALPAAGRVLRRTYLLHHKVCQRRSDAMQKIDRCCILGPCGWWSCWQFGQVDVQHRTTRICVAQDRDINCQ